MEQAKNIKLIALDMDGTLLTKDHEITPLTRQAISEAMDKGIHVVLSTGRWLKSCYPFAESLGLQSYLVTVNGGEIWTKDQELVEQHLFDSKKIEQMYHIATGLGLTTWMITTEQVYRNELPENVHELKWLKFGCESHDPVTLEKMIKELSFIDGLEMTNSLPTNLEVNPEGVNKAKGLEKVCNLVGITMDEVMAVGDSLNDIKMIQQAGVGVAMGNAQEAVKKASDYITDVNNADGVGKAIRRHAL
ncbi:Cof-type HAD-IIB family hydrolase [Virgibacillus dokdonensis]|uniref:Sugar phosphatase YidA n=1 Tax=Virgibacillus dokdonensis TaxID=302167 RepID=A0A2K9IZY6_9BACI|nr:Cof-type HAD-IIB family hydrolase [Virgibacillus dokdonensis]AUJ23311.1 Sugar phosphatase YidA [Virgibacillus dokdonensis]